jgi:hypothetical protein
MAPLALRRHHLVVAAAVVRILKALIYPLRVGRPF